MKILLLLPAVLLSQMAFCWGLTGHRVIAEIAEQHLSKKAKREIAKLFGKETLAWWSNWADFVKSDSTYDTLYSWHFVNLTGPFTKEEFITKLKTIPDKNLYGQIQAMQGELRDKSLPIERRRQALKLLVHFMGDLAQPLHSGHAEDQGGNKVVIYWFDKKSNLHSLWDSGLIDFQQYSYSEYAKLLDVVSQTEAENIQAGSLEDWFYESFQMAEKIYASASNDTKLGYTYNYQFLGVMNQQLLKGGLRLAAILNETFR